MPKSGFRVPHTLVLLFGMIVLAWILTLILPQGEFERVVNEKNREQVVPGSYGPVEEERTLTPWDMLKAIPKGFGAAEEIIFFIFIIGGAFGVFRATGAADATIGALIKTFGGAPALLIGGTMAVFAVGSSTIGMAEEYLPFVPMLLALCLALGYDSVTAIGVLCVGYGVGYGAALINPFTVFIAQDVADVPQGSGLGYRLALLVIFLAVGFHHVWSYASRVKKDPSKSLVADLAQTEVREKAYPRLTASHIAILVTIVAAIALLIVGLKFWDWYLIEMGGLFAGLTLVLAIVARMSPDETARQFCLGAAELTTTALLIGFARTIQVVLEEGQIIDTIVHGVAQPLSAVGPSLAAVGMFLVQSLCNFFIPSGSGQAYVTMPLMAPLADLVGVNRQVAVLAYQFGDGFTNIIVPTNAVLVGILAMAGIPFDRWLRFIVPFMIKVWLLGSLALAVAVWIGYQ